MRRVRLSCFLPLLCLAVAPALRADITVTFESLAEGETLANQFAPLGVVVSGSPMVFTAGSWLNEFDFPPHSGVNVLVDVGGPMLFAFSPAVSSVSGYFTYTTLLTLGVYASDGTLLAAAQSAGGANLGSSERIGFNWPAGHIGFLSIAGDPAGSSFILDDLTFGQAAQVPEPSSVLLIVPIAVFLFHGLRKRQ